MVDTTAAGAGRPGGRITTAGVALLAVFAGMFPLVVAPHGLVDDTDVLPKVLVSRAVVLVLALLWLARALANRTLLVRRTPLDLPVLALVASAALSTALSVSPALSLSGTYTRYEGLVTIVSYAALFWFGVQFIDEPRQARWLLRAMIAGAVVECVIALSQALFQSAGSDLSVFGETSTTFGGVARALGTMANANNLAIWLAMLIPPALYESFRARTLAGRVLAALATASMAITLVVTFGRAAWLGAACGIAVTAVLLLRGMRTRRAALVGAGTVGAALAVVIIAGTVTTRLGVPLLGSAFQRLASLADPFGGSGGTRVHLYSDTVGLIAGRPLAGYGPDTFGVVYPSHSTGDWTSGVVVDKAHSDLLQVAATQGVLGVAADVWLLFAAARMLTRTRNRPGVAGVLGGALAYQVGIQLNFAWFPVTAPFWILLIAAVALSGASWPWERRLPRSVPLLAGLGAAGTALLVVCCITQAVDPAVANAHYVSALNDFNAGRRDPALHQVALARAADPAQSEYAALQGDLEADLVGNHPGPKADLVGARTAYQQALADGDIFASVGIKLAYVDVALGDRAGAIEAARAARDLDPYGPAVKLVAELGG